MTLREMKASYKALSDKVRAALAVEDLTDEQWEALEKDRKDLESLAEDIKAAEAREERRLAMLASIPADPREALVPGNRGGRVEAHHIVVKKDAWQDDPKCGFASHREFLSAVMNYETRGAITPQLKFLAAAGSDEHSTLDNTRGGFLVPEGFLPDVKSVNPEADPTASEVMRLPMSTLSVKIPARVDKNHTSSVSGGLTVSYGAETQAATSSRMEMERIPIDAHAMKGLAYASEELLEYSAVSFMALLERGFADEFAAKRFEMKLRGTGNGQPKGVIGDAATVEVAAEGGQTADTINGTNLIKMRSRCWGWGNAIWLANHDTLPQLVACHIALTNGSAPLFVPGNGTDVPDTLLGRPIFFTEFASTLGDAGDIILGNWREYLWGTVGPDLRRADSVHVRFLENERTFKFWEYNDGKCWWRSALTPKKGANTLSPFVTLAAR